MTFEQIQDELAEIIRDRVLTRFGHAIDGVSLQTPPRVEMGDLATAIAMELARPLKKSPRDIATQLVENFPLPKIVDSVTVEGPGYINFRVNRNAFMRERFVAGNTENPATGVRVLVEHTNINPNKAAHIGHLRNAVLGDTLVRCLRFSGHDVEVQNYIDDTGVQVADVVVGFRRILEEGPEDVRRRIEAEDPSFDYFCWDLYARVASMYEENEEARQWRADTLHEIESQEGETAELAALIAEAIVRRHVATMWRLGIQYDALTEESDIIKKRFWHRAFELLKDSGAVVYEEEGKHAGCWVMKLGETEAFEGLEEPDKVLVRSNGTVTYVGKDIAYQLWKFGLLGETFGYIRFHEYPDGHVLWQSDAEASNRSGAPEFGDADVVYNVIDNRQAYLQKIVKEGLRLMGHEGEAERSVHFSYEMVALSAATAEKLGLQAVEDEEKKVLEMSGRKGVGVKADDLLDELEELAAKEVTARLRPEERDEIEVEALARQIAVAALRYFMLKYGTNRLIAFDFDEALTFEGDSGPYLQYSTVRVANIFRKLEERQVRSGLDEAELDQLTLGTQIDDEMWEIVRLTAQTGTVVARAVDALELSVITHHALELCQKFNTFYQKYSILNEQDPAERRRRAAVAELFRREMKVLLALLGIPLPERM